jgi:hypothetical protein
VPDIRSTGLGTTLLVGLVLLLLVIAGVAFLPLFQCLHCEYPTLITDPDGKTRPESCLLCQGKTKMTLYERWKCEQLLKSIGKRK